MLAHNQKGFSLVELLMAMALFSFVMVIMTTIMVSLYKVYHAGVNVRHTQDQARSITNELTNRARSADDVTASADGKELCILNNSAIPDRTKNEPSYRYYISGADGQKVLYRAEVSDYSYSPGMAPPPCDATQLPSASPVQVSSNNVYILDLTTAANAFNVLSYEFYVVARSTFSNEYDASTKECNTYFYCSITRLSSSVMAHGG